MPAGSGAALRIAAISSVIDVPNIDNWFVDSFAEIQRALDRQRVTPAGPRGGLCPTGFFTDEVADVSLFVPIAGAMEPAGNVVSRELPPVELAIAVHRGSLLDLDRTFGHLGAHVLERLLVVIRRLNRPFVSDEVPRLPSCRYWVKLPRRAQKVKKVAQVVTASVRCAKRR